jgi:hypothetical protein
VKSARLRVFAVALLICSTIVASAESPDAPHVVRTASVSPVINPVIRPSAGERTRVADRKFWTLTAYDLILTQIDVETTMRSLGNPACKETLSSAFVGKHPSRLRLQTTALAGNVSLAVLSYWMKKRGNTRWWWPQATAGTVHAGAAAWNHFGSGCY